MLLEDVHKVVRDLVQILRKYGSNKKTSQGIVSSPFKRRLEEVETVVEVAISWLQVRFSSSLYCVAPFAHMPILLPY